MIIKKEKAKGRRASWEKSLEIPEYFHVSGTAHAGLND
jgi:hypothetical protein